MSRQWYIVGYDVRHPKRLRKVAKILEGYGHRIQFSIFKVQASQRQIERLRWELSGVLDEVDHLLIVGLCAKCAQEVQEQGLKQMWEAEPPNFVVLGGVFKDPSVLKEEEAHKAV